MKILAGNEDTVSLKNEDTLLAGNEDTVLTKIKQK